MTLIQPSDDLGHEVAKILITPCAARDRLIAGMYLPDDEQDIMGQLNAAMNAVMAAEPVEAKVRAAQKAGRITAKAQDAVFEEAKSLSVITDTELALWKRARVLSKEVVRVDDFDMHFGVSVVQSTAKQNADVTKYAEAAE
jgi:acyl-CoA dehydrogenase